MRDDVMQLAGDPNPLLGNGEPRLLLALPLQALGTVGQKRGLDPLAAEGKAHSVGGGKHEPGRHGVFEPAPTRNEVDEIADDDGTTAERAGNDRPAALGMGAEGVEDDEQGDPMLEGRLVRAGIVNERDLEPDRGEHECKDDGRCPPPPGEGKGDQKEDNGVREPRTGNAVVEERMGPDLVLRRPGEGEREQGVQEIARTQFRPPACAHGRTVARRFPARIRPNDDPRRPGSPSRATLQSGFRPTKRGPRRTSVEPVEISRRLEMQERILPRLGAVSGVLFVVLLFGPSSSGSDSQIVVALELLGLLLFIPFLGYLWSLLRAAEGPGGWLSATALGAGLVGITMKLASIGPGWAARDFDDGTAIHKALDRMNEVAFVAQMLPDGVMLAAIAIVTLKTSALPRWLGWLAAVAAPLLVVNGMFLDAEFGPAFLLFMLWTLLASVVLTVRPSGVQSQAAAVTHSPIPA
jgi:hypothetical protein